MPSVPRIVLQRQKHRAARQRRPALPAGLAAGLLFSLLLVAAFTALAVFVIDLTRDLPAPEMLSILLDPPGGLLLQPTRLYDRSDSHLLLTLENPAAPGRRYVPLHSTTAGHLPEEVAWAALAAADPHFWDHGGIDWGGLDLRRQPTLAQRLASELLLWDEPAGLRRDLRVSLLAAQITARFGREKVLEWYLNSAKYGRMVYGVDAAAQVYFGKPAEELNLAEAALLAAVAEAPELNPLVAPQMPLERQKGILGAMLDQGRIDTEQAQQALLVKLQFRPGTQARGEIAPAFTNLVLEQVSTSIPLERVERGGLRIRTSLDYTLQIQADCTVQAESAHRSPGQAAAPGQAADGSPCEAARLLPSPSPASGGRMEGFAAQVVALDPHTGQVLALVGSLAPGLDPAHLPGRSPGTLITPFIYLTAFTRGWSPASLAWDVPGDPAPGAGRPEPASLPEGQADPGGVAAAYHGPVSLRAALANDYQAPASALLSQIGPEHVWRAVQQLGLSSLELPVLQRAHEQRTIFVDGEVTLLQMSQAFGVFASGGILAGQISETGPAGTGSAAGEIPPIQPVSVLKVEGIDHQVWMDCQDELIHCSPAIRPVLSPQLAYLLTHVLSDETARWPSLKHPNLLEIGRPAGAKIGATRDGLSAWTIGYTPQVVVGVWAGAQGAAHSAAALWQAVIKYATRSLPPQNWPAPPGIAQVEVCEPSGMLPTEYCPSIANEIFITGNEPTYPDTLYRAYQVNRETGRLATVFTPPALVEERVYLAVPPDALHWAEAAGLPVPPDLYDVISQPPPSSGDARIDSPGMFAYVRGTVDIHGRAAGDDFSFYRIQAGRGLNPQEWLQIGEDTGQAVRDGWLGEWDTRGLSGLYALQLRVVHADQRVESAIIQVTVDNLAPEVHILQPARGREISAAQESTVIFEAAAADDLALAEVTFTIDGEWVATLSQSPYLIAWKPAPGKHLLQVTATDRAGNTSRESLEFEVVP